MKNLLKYISILTLFVFAGCSDFLDLEPVSQIGEGDFFSNQKEVEQGVIACYSGLQAPIKDEWLLTELRTDNTRMRNLGSSSNRSVQITQYDEANFYSTDEALSNYWANSYKNIKNCHKVLQHVNLVADTKLKEQFLGEMYFIRAYHYFNLVRLYKDVFAVTSIITADQAKSMSTTPTSEIYRDIIEKDLLNAIEYLPETYIDSEKGHATKLAAKALLAKVYLTQKRYGDAQTLLLQIYQRAKEDANLIGLVSPYSDVFSPTKEMNKEIMFSVRYHSGGYGVGNTFSYSFAAYNALEAGLKGEGENYPTQSIVKSYDPVKDDRKNVCLKTTYKSGTKDLYDNWVYKYFSVVTLKEDGGNDWPILRYADVLLMLAEVQNEIDNDPGNAFQYINPVRSRAGLGDLTAVDCPNAGSFRLALENERRWEFAFENQRFFDLIRTGRFNEVMNDHFQTETYIANANTGAEAVDTPTNPNGSKYYWDNDNQRFRGYPMTDDKHFLPMPNWETNVSDIY